MSPLEEHGHQTVVAKGNPGSAHEQLRAQDLAVPAWPAEQFGHSHHTRGIQGQPQAFTPLIDAKVASRLLGVPYTWLLAQARAGQIPHHRLGHYVRFNPDDLKEWLAQTRSGIEAGARWHP